MMRKIDVENLKFIDVSELPSSRRSGAYYERLFETIPNGKALMLERGVGTESGARLALKRLRKLGKFADYWMVRRNNIAYIVNSDVMMK